MLWVLLLRQMNWLHLGLWYSQSLLRETDLCLVIQQKEFSVDTSLDVLEELQGKIGWAGNPKVGQKNLYTTYRAAGTKVGKIFTPHCL